MYWLLLIPLLFATQVNAQTLSLEAEEFLGNIIDCNDEDDLYDNLRIVAKERELST